MVPAGDATHTPCHLGVDRGRVLERLLVFAGRAPDRREAGEGPAAAKRLNASGDAVIDVRTTDEFADGHVPGALNIPVAELERRMGEVATLVKADKTAAIVVYCASGSRASQAQQTLSAAGYARIVNGGGFDDLQ